MKIFARALVLPILLFYGSAFAQETTLRPPRMSIGVSWVHSRWNQLSSNVKNGSTDFFFELSRQVCPHFETGLAAHFFAGVPNSSNDNDIGGYHIDLNGRFFFKEGALRPYAGLGFAIGGYRAWGVTSENDSLVTYAKYASGTLVGFTPQVGVRIDLTQRFSLDVYASYAAFFDSPANKVGGWSAGFSAGFSR